MSSLHCENCHIRLWDKNTGLTKYCILKNGVYTCKKCKTVMVKNFEEPQK